MRRYVPVLVLLAAMLAAFALLAAHGARQADRDVRVLGELEPVIQLICGAAAPIAWIETHGQVVGVLVTAAAALTALLGLRTHRRGSAPVAWLAASAACATWGQVLLWYDHPTVGLCLYLVAIGIAAVAGARAPLPQPIEPLGSAAWWPLWLECGLVFALFVLGLAARLYALTELPSYFNGEAAPAMLASYSFAGLREYLPGFVQPASMAACIGLVHLLPQMLFLRLLGPSVYALRLTAVALSIWSVPLYYWLVRRLAGRSAAAIATLLLATAAEQLWWARLEHSYFATLPLLAVVSVELVWWMLRRWSLASVVANALWMPVTRYFYLAGLAMFAYPWIVSVHAALFRRGAWRRAWYVVPILAGGTLLWLFSISIVSAPLDGWRWHFINPVFHPEAINQRAEQSGSDSLLGLAQHQAVSLGENLATIAQMLTYRGGSTMWYQRYDPSQHPSTMNVGVTVLVAVGLGYLLGQLRDPRAGVLVALLGLGLLPALMSGQPLERRFALAFPAMYAIVGVTLAALLQLLRARGTRAATAVVGALVTVATVAIVWTGMASHFLLRTAPEPFQAAFRFVRPLFDSGAVYYNLEGQTAFLLAVGSADRFTGPRVPCFQYTGPRDWLRVALQQPCDFNDATYYYTMSRARRGDLAARYRPNGAVSFLLSDTPSSQPHLTLLRALFPEAREHRAPLEEGRPKLVSLTVDRAFVEARQVPAVVVGGNEPDGEQLAAGLLAGVHLRVVTDAAPSTNTVVRAGLLLEQEAWYRLRIEPRCPSATLAIDRQLVGQDDPPQPWLAGVHALELTIPSTADCRLPLQVQAERLGTVATTPLLLDPIVAERPELGSPPLLRDAGYSEIRMVRGLRGNILDIGVDAEGSVTVLAEDDDGMVVRRFDATWREQTAWRPRLPSGQRPSNLMVAPGGDVTLLVEHMLLHFDRTGARRGVWEHPPLANPNVTMLPDGRMLSAMPDHAAVLVVGRDGMIEREWREFTGGPKAFSQPTATAITPQGDVAVAEMDGRVLLFAPSVAGISPRFVREIHLQLTQDLALLVPLAFAGPDRLIVGDQGSGRVLEYTVAGERVVASDPDHDLNTHGITRVRRLAATAGRVYLLDETQHLWEAVR